MNINLSFKKNIYVNERFKRNILHIAYFIYEDWNT